MSFFHALALVAAAIGQAAGNAGPPTKAETHFQIASIDILVDSGSLDTHFSTEQLNTELQRAHSMVWPVREITGFLSSTDKVAIELKPVLDPGKDRFRRRRVYHLALTSTCKALENERPPEIVEPGEMHLVAIVQTVHSLLEVEGENLQTENKDQLSGIQMSLEDLNNQIAVKTKELDKLLKLTRDGPLTSESLRKTVEANQQSLRAARREFEDSAFQREVLTKRIETLLKTPVSKSTNAYVDQLREVLAAQVQVLDRTKQLRDQSVVSESEMLRQQTAVANARAELMKAESSTNESKNRESQILRLQTNLEDLVTAEPTLERKIKYLEEENLRLQEFYRSRVLNNIEDLERQLESLQTERNTLNNTFNRQMAAAQMLRLPNIRVLESAPRKSETKVAPKAKEPAKK